MIVANAIILKTVKSYYHADSDKGLYEPNVVKATRSVLRRVQERNLLFLSDKETHTVPQRGEMNNYLFLFNNYSPCDASKSEYFENRMKYQFSQR